MKLAEDGVTAGKGANGRFLRAVFGVATPNAYITAFTEDPTGDYPLGVRGKMWGGGIYAALRESLTADANQYVCVSTFNASRDPKDNGRPRRQRALFNRCYAIMVDDIGTKVKAESVRLEPFTCVVETSPGNFQGWYALRMDDPDAADPVLVDFVVDAMIRGGLAKVDPGMKGVTRYGRLPEGVNNKAKLGAAWNVKMTECSAEVGYTLREIAEAYYIDLDGAKPDPLLAASGSGTRGNRVTVPEDERERYAAALIAALEKAECAPHEHPNKPGGYDLRCPWYEDHTGKDETGSMLFIPGYVDPGSGVEFTLGGYKCHHGHCENRRLRHVIGWLNENHGATLVGPSWLAFPPLPAARELGADSGIMLNSETGMPRKNDHNLDVILRHDPLYAHSSGFQLSWDTFSNETYAVFESETVNEIVHVRAPGRGVPEEMAMAVKLDIFRTHHVDFTVGAVTQMLAAKLNNNRFDSAMEWGELVSKRWDGVARLDMWLIECAGAKDNDYVREVSRLTLTAAAKRAMSPGFKFDQMLILEGLQGIGKSGMLSVMAPRVEWYASTHFDVQKKDAVSDSIGKLIIEFEELQSLRRSDHIAMKGYLSRTSDRVRLPYERMSADIPRRGVFIGTTNDVGYLTDATGNRRYWPVKLIGAVKFKRLIEIKELLWAEACAKAKTVTEPHELDLSAGVKSFAARETEKRSTGATDPWRDAVAGVLRASGGYVVLSEVLSKIGVSVASQTKADQLRAGAVMRSLGWVTAQRVWTKGRGKFWAWTPVGLE